MPPKPKFTKEEIVRAAYELLQERGMDAVVAREVGKQLGTTTGPVFTYFDSMEELKTEVHELARKECMDYFREALEYDAAFKEFGLRWIRYATKYPHVYALLFMTKSDKPMLYGFMDEKMREILDPMVIQVKNYFGLKEEDAENVIKEMCIFAQGMASMNVNGLGNFTEEETSDLLSRLCVSRVAGCKIMDDTIDMEKIRFFLAHTERMPERKKS